MCLQRKTITSKKVCGPHPAPRLLNPFWRPIRHHVNCRQQSFHHPGPSHLHTSFLGAERAHVHFNIFQQQSRGWVGGRCVPFSIYGSSCNSTRELDADIYIILPFLTPTSRLAEVEGNTLGRSLPITVFQNMNGANWFWIFFFENVFISIWGMQGIS